MEVTIVDVSTGEKGIEKLDGFSLITRKDVLSSIPIEEGKDRSLQLPADRGESISIMSKALNFFLQKFQEKGNLVGAIGLGGSGGTSLISPALRFLPIGVPKIIVSTVASGQTGHYVGNSDLILIPSVVDHCGLNRVSRVVLSNSAAALAGMVVGSFRRHDDEDDGLMETVGITMFGVTTPCVTMVSEMLNREGFETLVFHATGSGGRAMEDLVRGGVIKVVTFLLVGLIL